MSNDRNLYTYSPSIYYVAKNHTKRTMKQTCAICESELEECGNCPTCEFGARTTMQRHSIVLEEPTNDDAWLESSRMDDLKEWR